MRWAKWPETTTSLQTSVCRSSRRAARPVSRSGFFRKTVRPTIAPIKATGIDSAPRGGENWTARVLTTVPSDPLDIAAFMVCIGRKGSFRDYLVRRQPKDRVLFLTSFEEDARAVDDRNHRFTTLSLDWTAAFAGNHRRSHR